MNADMKTIAIAAIMIIAAVSVVSLYADDSDGATGIQIEDGSVNVTEEANPFTGETLYSLNFTFSSAPATGEYSVSIIDRSTGNVLENDAINANGNLKQFACQIDQHYDVEAITIMVNINGENVQWPATASTEYTVTFMVDGAEYTTTETVGGIITVPAAPVKEGYTFLYWSATENGTEYDMTAPITGPVTLYAVFEAGITEYTVTFVIEGTEFYVTVEAGQIVPGNQVPAVPDNFDHWSTTENGTEAYDPTSTPVNGDITLYAVMTNLDPQTYTITWVNYDGTTLATTQVAEGEMPEYTGATPVREADSEYTYTFAGWEPEVVAATDDATYTATYDETPVGSDADDPDRTFTSVITLGDNVEINDQSGINASAYQEVLITGDVTVIDGGFLYIDGKLTIAEGASLTLMSGADVQIYDGGVVDVQGDLTVEGAKAGGALNSFTYAGARMTVSGNVYLEGAHSFLSNGTGIQISGLFEVGDEATAQLEGATVAQGGQLVVYGVASGAVSNNGTITIDTEGLQDRTGVSLDITMAGPDATVDGINVYGTVTVTDAGMEFTQGRDTYTVVNSNTVTLTGVSGAIVTESLVITEDEQGNPVGTNTMYVSGNVVYAVDFNAENTSGTIAVAGQKVEIAADTVLGAGITLNVDGKLTVSANLTATETIPVSATETRGQILVNDEITVTGKVTTVNSGFVVGQNGIVNAALYKTTSPVSSVYTTLETALTDGATNIDLLGKNAVVADATIPVGTTVTMAADSTLTINEEATLTVAADDRRSGRFTTVGTDTVDVKGTLIVEDFAKSRVSDASILSDTYKDVDGAYTYTNVYSALENAADGEVVEITRSNAGALIPVVLDRDVTIAAGVTLYVPAGQQVTVGNDVTVTVTGTVYAAGGYTMAGPVTDADGNVEQQAGATVVNGMMVYTNGSDDVYKSKIVGAYFGYVYTFDGRDTPVEAIAPLESVPGIMADVTSDIELHGEMSVGAVDFSAYDGDLRTVKVMNDLTIENLTLGDDVAFDASDAAAVVTGTVTLANGTVEMDNVNGVVAQNEYDSAEDVTTSVVSGTVTAVDDTVSTPNVVETGSVSVTGEVTLSGLTLGVSGAAAQYVSMDVPAGATATVVNGGQYYAPVTVEGTVTVSGNGAVFQSLAVTGTVGYTEKYSAQAVKLYVGVTPDDYAMAGTGTVSGVTLQTGNVDAVAYVSPNATVEGDLAGLKSTAYYADDELYLTAYAIENNTVGINEVTFVIEDAWFNGWVYTDETTGNVTTVTDEFVGTPDRVDASIERNIYNVLVMVDSGIGSVAIDGNVLVNYIGNFYQTTTPLTAGQHTISYTLKSGYQGEATLSVIGENATVSGLNFTLSGTPADANGITVQLSLSGTEPADTTIVVGGGSGDDGLGLTEILLIILVILIVIMAIIVALRLMRS